MIDYFYIIAEYSIMYVLTLSIIFKLRHVVVLLLHLWRGRGQGYSSRGRLGRGCSYFWICTSMGDGEEFLAMVEVGNESSASLGLVGVEVLLELRILGLEQHGDLLGLLILKIGLLLRTVGGGVASLITDGALDGDMSLGLEGTGPGTVALLLTVVAVVVIDALHLQVVAVQQVLQLLVFLSVQDLLDFVNSLL